MSVWSSGEESVLLSLSPSPSFDDCDSDDNDDFEERTVVFVFAIWEEVKGDDEEDAQRRHAPLPCHARTITIKSSVWRMDKARGPRKGEGLILLNRHYLGHLRNCMSC